MHSSQTPNTIWVTAQKGMMIYLKSSLSLLTKKNEVNMKSNSLRRLSVRTNPLILGTFQKQIAIIDSKIKKTQLKVENPTWTSESIPAELQDKMDGIDQEVKRLLREIETLGEIGKIEEAEKFMEELERLKASKEDMLTLAQNPTLAAKQMKVCEICGAMQAINDTETRNQNHLEGKVHTGFALLRKELEELKKRREILKIMAKAYKRKGDEVRLEKREEKKEKKHKDPSKEKDRRKDKDKERDRRKEKDRKHKHHRDRSRSKERDRKRKRSHEKSHRRHA